MRLHSLLLYLYPSSFRSEYGEEISRLFAARLRQTTNPFSRLIVWLAEMADIVSNAARVHWDILRQDLRYTLRTLGRTPGFTLTAILVTGLGIGANTAVFSVTDQVILRPLPYRDAERLVRVWENPPGYRMELSPPNFRDWRRLTTSFESMAAYSGISLNLIAKGDPRRLSGISATADLLPMLGVEPVLGRIFTVDDLRDNAPPTVLLSYALWQSEFGADPAILGHTVRLDDALCSVIGVMPADFHFPSRTTQIWTPLRFKPINGDDDRDNNYLYGVGKLRSGTTLAQASAEMQVVAAQLERQFPKENEKTGVLVERMSQVQGQPRLLLIALFAASLCVLLMACANLASLLLARAMGRRRELAVRAAIGAGRERLVRQLLTESLVLAVLGGLVGIAVAILGVPLLAVLVPTGLPVGEASALDPRVFVFAGIVTLLTGLAFGVLPAWRVCSGQEAAGLREGSRSGIGGHKEKLRSALVIAEVSVSIVLLVSSGLLIRALWQVQSVDPGFRSEGVLTVQTPLPIQKYASVQARTAFYSGVLAEVRAQPGVASASYISFLPMLFGGIWPVDVPGSTGTAVAAQDSRASLRFVTPGFFATLGIPVQQGRDVSESDSFDSPWVAVISESFARRYFPAQDPLGRQFNFAFRDRVVVGVVGNIRFRGLEQESEPQVYLSYRQVTDGAIAGYIPKELVIRSAGNSAGLVAAVRRIIQKADPELPIAAIRPLRDVVDEQTAARRTQIQVLGAFAALALLLAGVGIHGLLAFAVGQRTAEFGLRIALGAQRHDILTMVLGEGLLLACIGTAGGLVLSYYAGRSMQALLAGVPPSDPLTFVVAGLVAFAMTLSGSLVPALRAVRVDPTTAIRGD